MNVNSVAVILTCTAQTILHRAVTERVFSSHFGIRPSVAAVLYLHVSTSNIKPEWLLMGLNFLYQYDTEELNSTRFGIDEKTFRMHCWKTVKVISDLSFICLENRNRYGNLVEK